MAKIQWNKVTWYSEALALVLFAVALYVGFFIGREYQAIRDGAVASAVPAVAIGQPMINDVTFTCDAGKTIRAQFYQNDVELELSDGRHLVVPHAISADGARYAATDGSFVFWTRGQGAFIEEGTGTAPQSRTYSGCVVTK